MFNVVFLRRKIKELQNQTKTNMTEQGQNEIAFPAWLKHFLWFLFTFGTVIIGVMMYVSDMKSDIAVLKSENNAVKEEHKALKEWLQRDIDHMKKDLEDVRKLLDEKK